MTVQPLHNQSKILYILIYSMLVGAIFASSWLGFTAVAAQDGRQAITDWLDPMLASLTLFSILIVQLGLTLLWPHLTDSRLKTRTTWGLIISQWLYILGEILSNTITIGEPPQDIGSLLEISAGVLVLFCILGLLISYVRSQEIIKPTYYRLILNIIAVLLLAGMFWWFTHPIDQSQPGAPSCIPDNPVYNLFHELCP